MHPTRRCNHRCRMCFLWSKSPDSLVREYKKSEKDIRFWKRVVDEIRHYGSSCGISGGEPFLYKPVWELVEYIRERGLSCSVNTNGFLLKDQAGRAASAGLDLLRISIDGLHRTHDDIRRSPGSFDRIVEGLTRLTRRMEESGSQAPAVEIFYTMTNTNLHQMVDFIRFFEEYRVRNIKFIHPIFMNEKEVEECRTFLQDTLSIREMPYYDGASVESVLPDTEILIREIRRVKSMSTDVRILFFPDFDDGQTVRYYSDHENFCRSFRHRCRAPWFSMLVHHDGSVESCPEFIVGHLEQESLSSIWNNARMRSLRSVVRKEGIIPLCHGCCNLFQNV